MIEKILDIYTSPFTAIGKLFFETRKGRIIVTIISIIFGLLSTGILLYTLITVHDIQQRKHILEEILPITAIPFLFVGTTFVFYLVSKTKNELETQLEQLKEEREEITQKIENEDTLDIFHTIQLSLNQLNEYYTINKAQAKSSFRFSIFAIIVGLVTIVTGIWLNYLNSTHVGLSYLTGIAGILMEFIGGAYFFMYKKSLQQVNFFFGQLIKIQDTMLSINLANNISVESKRIEMHEKIILSLLERSLK